jgi:hypothetical protein
MTLSSGWRLALYNLMSALPIWVNFVHNSQDFSFRGLLGPALDSLYAMVVVTLAKTAPTGDADAIQPVRIVNTAARPVPVSEQPAVDKGSPKP